MMIDDAGDHGKDPDSNQLVICSGLHCWLAILVWLQPAVQNLTGNWPPNLTFLC